MNASMSTRLHRNRAFLTLLLSSDSKQQQLALLKTITPQQLDSIGEILHNILHIVGLSEPERKFVKRKANFAQKLTNLARSVKFRKRHLVNDKVRYLQLLLHFKDKLLEVLT